MTSNDDDKNSPTAGEQIGTPSIPQLRMDALQWRERAVADKQHVSDIRLRLTRVEQIASAGGGVSHRVRIANACVVHCLNTHAEVAASAEAVQADASDDAADTFGRARDRLQLAVWTCCAAAIDLRAEVNTNVGSPYEEIGRLMAEAADWASHLLLSPALRLTAAHARYLSAAGPVAYDPSHSN